VIVWSIVITLSMLAIGGLVWRLLQAQEVGETFDED
jgi:hypothetical protein